jgi:carboxypeptidase Q
MAAGVPVIDILQEGTAYFDVHHTANDTLDKITPRDLDFVVAAWLPVVYAAAAIDDDFGRLEPPAPPAH